MVEELNIARVRNTLDFLDAKITALNRGFIMLLNVLQDNGLINENSMSWIDKVKRDGVLAKAIDKDDLMGKVLGLAPNTVCPEKSEDAIALVKRHVIKPKPTKVKLPKL